MVAPDRDKLRRAFRVPTARPFAVDGERPLEAPATSAPSPAPSSGAGARPGTMREFLLRRQQQFAEPPRAPVALPPGDDLTTPHGVLWRRELRYPLAGCHGDVVLARVRQLFPEGRLSARRVTLAPPLARVLCRLHPALYGLFNGLPLLRTHRLAWIAKPGP